MGILFYRISTSFYFLLIRLAALFSPKARAFIKGRQGIFDDLNRAVKNDSSPVIWIHCASLGEFEQGRPVIEQLKKEYPNFKIMLTFFSPSGYEVRKNYPGADFIYYLPLDNPRNAKRFIDITQPSCAIFVKYEFWHFYLKALNQRKILVISVSSIFRSNQIFFKSYGGFQRKTLKYIDHFFVQNQQSLDLLTSIQIKKATLSGDTRFDRVYDTSKTVKPIDGVNDFLNGSEAMVIGSSWPEDMEVLHPFIVSNSLKFIIAPHEIDERGISQITNRLTKSYARYSEGKKAWIGKDILIIDNVGLLSQLYMHGSYAYIGGAFGKGLHNTLEAATFGLPIFFGNKNYKKFHEAVQLSKFGAAFPIGDYDEMQIAFDSLNDSNGKSAEQYVLNNLGATQKIISYLKETLD